MSKIIILMSILLLMVLGGCRRDAGIVSKTGIKFIHISFVHKRNFKDKAKEVRITDTDSIKYIVRELNNCNREPVLFYPTHKLLINYENSKVLNITCNGKGLKDNEGHTYMLNKEIEEILGF